MVVKHNVNVIHAHVHVVAPCIICCFLHYCTHNVYVCTLHSRTHTLHMHTYYVYVYAAWDCREVWPDDVFGKSGMSVDEEMEAIRNLFVHPSTGKPIVNTRAWGGGNVLPS